uniref:Chromosome 8 open reading frame 76 n=1 Tax=Chelonoidis abingdonii TaxID=106734 RepID=A0A8C0GAV2_CHEAB
IQVENHNFSFHNTFEYFPLCLQWFCEDANSEGDVEILTAKKFRGDLAYRQQEFQKALYEYSSCLLLLPSSNVAMRRDVQEGQARCLAHLGRHQEALDIAEKLRNGATNTDHLTTVLNLQFAIYCRLKNIEKKITCLQQLISLHPFNPWNWKLLAETYMSFLQTLPPSFISEMKHLQCKDCTANDHVFQTSPGLFGKEMNLQCHKTLSGRQDIWSTLPTNTTRDNSVSYSDSHMVKGSLHITEECETRDKMKHATFEFWGQEALKDVWIKACASFVRTRLLLQITQLQQSSFALDQNLKVQQETEDKVKGFGLKEESLLLITKVMGEDLIPEKLKEDGQEEIKCVGPSALTSLVTTSAIEFEGKWFKKLQDSLSL